MDKPQNELGLIWEAIYKHQQLSWEEKNAMSTSDRRHPYCPYCGEDQSGTCAEAVSKHAKDNLTVVCSRCSERFVVHRYPVYYFTTYKTNHD